MRYYIGALIAAFSLAQAKQVTIIGPAIAAFNGGQLCVSYTQGKEVIREQCMPVQAGNTYTFWAPDCASHVIVERSYATGDYPAKGRFRLCDGPTELDLEVIGCRLQLTKHRFEYDSQVPPLRTGIVYGWTWR